VAVSESKNKKENPVNCVLSSRDLDKFIFRKKQYYTEERLIEDATTTEEKK
jgi:hypothetical protein